MISETEKAVVEIGCGAWAFSALSLTIVFGVYVYQRWRFDVEWRDSPTVRAALALAIFGLASAMRGLLAWYRYSHQDWEGVGFITTWWPWFEVSVFLNCLGAVLAVYILAPGYRTWLATSIVFVSFAIPTWVWVFH